MRRALLGSLMVCLLSAGGCRREGVGGSAVAGGQNSRMQADRYVGKAVRRSPEGFILIPSRYAERAFDRHRMNETAQEMRRPAAVCFINRAIETMQRGVRDGEAAFVDVPEGQAKFRVRINQAGTVVRTEVLESGFADPAMETCLREVLAAGRWPENRTGNTHFVDVVYWVSLGFGEEDASPAAKEALRRQTALAALRAKSCLAGRTQAGRYAVEGLSLLDRDGRTLVNRLEPSELPEKVAECVMVALREIRLGRAPEAFVRPITPSVTFVVDGAGEVSFEDERWLALVLAEEEGLREQRRAEMAGEVDLGPDEAIARAAREADAAAEAEAVAAAKAQDEAAARDDAAAKPSESATKPGESATKPGDPGKGGLKLNLGGRAR
ncbi:MAG: hypothetical protein IPK80_22960 [Nannocystis sp.]|nr:hypothetical protein [Nannocystis sp.]